MEETVKQAIKYGIVGVSNTVITAVVIWIMMKLFGCSDVVSNMVGYVAGVLNSLYGIAMDISKFGWLAGSAVRFGVVFGVCYLLQLGFLVCVLTPYLPIDPYYNQLIAMAFTR